MRRAGRNKSIVVVPTPIHALRVKGNAIFSVSIQKEIVVDLKGSRRPRRGLGKGRDERPFPSPPVLAGFRRAAFKGRVGDVRRELDGDGIETGDCRFYSP